MKVKALDIARELKLSRATVSLALNNKPGVKEETRRQIFECKKRMENGEDLHGDPAIPGGIIKVISVNNHLRGVEVGDVLDLWTIADSLISKIALQWGMAAEVLYYDPAEDPPSLLQTSCNRSAVKGVIISGSEACGYDPVLLQNLKKIRKPKVIYDCDLGDEISCIVFHNRGGVRMAVDYLRKRGKRQLFYLSRGISFFNYTERRSGFLEAVSEFKNEVNGSVITVGNSVSEIADNTRNLLRSGALPDAIVAESYHVSIGVTKALQSMGLSLPEDISLVGIDEIPEYMTGGKRLTMIKIPHAEKVQWVMEALRSEMYLGLDTKMKLLVNCKIVEGESVSG